MPTYQYACTDPDCNHRFEQFQSFTDEALSVCPVCSGRLRKVYGSVGVVFKGSGFYRNDSRAETNGAKKKSSDSGSDASNASSSSSATSSTDSGSAGADTSLAKDSSDSSSTKTSDSSSKAPAKSGSSSAGNSTS